MLENNCSEKPKYQQQEEKKMLNLLAQHYSSRDGLNGLLCFYVYKTLRKYFRGDICLELGAADGQMTQHLLQDFKKVVSIDGSKNQIEKLNTFLSSAKLETKVSLVEDFEYPSKFDTIVISCLLEHVNNPIEVLQHIKKFAKPETQLLIDVPNAHSFHRYLGKEIGLLRELTELKEHDYAIGHKRYYTPETLKNDISASGLTLITTGGIFFKPLSNSQLENWDKKILEGLYSLSSKFPMYCSNIYAVCTI